MADYASIASPKRLRILALGPQDVFPPVDGGKEGIYGALTALARLADVSYAYPATTNASIEGYARIGVIAIPIPHMPQERLASIIASTLRGLPYKFGKYSADEAVQGLNDALPDTKFDAILCHHAHTYRLACRLAALRGWTVPIVVREHNIEYALVDSFRDSLRGLKRAAASLFAALTRREELHIWREADAVAFLSDQDLRTAQAACAPTSSSGRFILAREGVPQPARRPVRFPGPKAPLLVLLNPRATQSVHNLRDFVHRYWIPLRERHKLVDEVLHVTGVTDAQLAPLVDVEPARMRALGLRGLGFLPSLAPTLESALALVSPTFVGGGIRKKVLEAMAHQLPVIATRFDIECCDYFQPDVNIIPLEGLDDFAETVARLRRDEALWSGLSKRSRDTVEEFASWDRYAQAMIEVIRDLKRSRHP
ncbi:hypothetical protein CLD22_11030 [Rubrivivax gelatinosus]|nr:hypothetical protein [Rubrivivax gelatinosus]